MWEKFVNILNPYEALKKALHKTNNSKNKKNTCRFKKKADVIRSMTDKELARYLAATQIHNAKEICSSLGLVFNETDNMLEDATQEMLEGLQQFVEV